MQTQSNAAKRAATLAALADPARNDNAAERATAAQKLFAHCEKHNLDAFAFAPFLRPEPAHEKPSAAADGARAKRRAIVAEIVASIRVVYAGASPSYRRSGKAHTFETYADTCAKPRQSIGPNGPTERDESALLGLIERSDANGAFDPVALCLDLGAFSRLASVDFIHRDGNAFAFTTAGLSRARGVVSRAR
jgi:hypothetical protein